MPQTVSMCAARSPAPASCCPSTCLARFCTWTPATSCILRCAGALEASACCTPPCVCLLAWPRIMPQCGQPPISRLCLAASWRKARLAAADSAPGSIPGAGRSGSGQRSQAALHHPPGPRRQVRSLPCCPASAAVQPSAVNVVQHAMHCVCASQPNAVDEMDMKHSKYNVSVLLPAAASPLPTTSLVCSCFGICVCVDHTAHACHAVTAVDR